LKTGHCGVRQLAESRCKRLIIPHAFLFQEIKFASKCLQVKDSHEQPLVAHQTNTAFDGSLNQAQTGTITG
jgi:hypothetical protein